MSTGQPSRERPPAGRLARFLERVTAAVLVAVLVILAWMLLTAYQPTWVRLPWPGVEIALVIALFTAALVLVSVVALLHTRG
jgi:hypothetical protein